MFIVLIDFFDSVYSSLNLLALFSASCGYECEMMNLGHGVCRSTQNVEFISRKEFCYVNSSWSDRWMVNFC